MRCLGCDLVESLLGSPEASEEPKRFLVRLGFAVLLAMNVMVFTIAMWTRDLYVQQASPLSETVFGLFQSLAMLAASGVLWLLGLPMLRGAWSALVNRRVTTDMLILLAVSAAYLFSVVSFLRGAGPVYFEVPTMVLVFMSLGRWLELNASLQTQQSLDGLARLLPDAVLVLRGGRREVVTRQDVVLNDLVQVAPGERLAVDGRVAWGEAELDESLLTGESRPVWKRVGDSVYSGSLNINGHLQPEVTAAAGQETVSRMLQLMRAARSSKGEYARLADRVAAWFVPGVCVLAVATGCYWGSVRGWDSGVLSALSVLLIACPCALGLATPLAVSMALDRASQDKVLFRSGKALEQLGEIRAVRFDKTGTLTTG
ncbi:MAG: cation-translocating P-type ATPase, partial [Planctomycetales bacterium]|nr:cation-translocating P-type ATPase [Planctomycetales bacterium]